jgi:hypothetical protein
MPVQSTGHIEKSMIRSGENGRKVTMFFIVSGGNYLNFNSLVGE